MVQNLTEAIQDRKQNKLNLIYLIFFTFKYLFYKFKISKSSDAKKNYVCYHVLVYPYSVILSFNTLQKWHSPSFGILLETNDGFFDVASGKS